MKYDRSKPNAQGFYWLCIDDYEAVVFVNKDMEVEEPGSDINLPVHHRQYERAQWAGPLKSPTGNGGV